MTREYETLFAENFSFWEHLTEDQKEERRKRLQENVLHTINNRDKTDLKSI